MRGASPSGSFLRSSQAQPELWIREVAPGQNTMLDFAIFAITFLLALVAAVLYLYPVTAHSALWGSGRRPRPRGAHSHVFLPAAGLRGRA